VQSTKCQCGYLEDNPLWNTKAVKTDEYIVDMFGSPHVENKLHSERIADAA